MSAWKEIKVPADWQTEGYDQARYNNITYPFPANRPLIPHATNPVGSYRRDVNLPAGWAGQDILLHIGAAGSAYYVWVNGRKVGYSEDGVLEAVVSREHTFVVGVQWHPEAMVPKHAPQTRLFKAFGDAVRAYDAGARVVLRHQHGRSEPVGDDIFVLDIDGGVAIDSRYDACAFADIDHDGRLDLYQTNVDQEPFLFRNVSPGGGHWIGLKLIGTKSNRDAIGARVRVKAGGQTWTQWNDGKSGYLSQSSMPLYFGFGDATKIDRIEVLWPSGKKQELVGDILSSFT